MTDIRESLRALRANLLWDLDEGSNSPPSICADLDAFAGADLASTQELHCIISGDLLLRLMRGMAPDDLVLHGSSYFGLSSDDIADRLSQLRRVGGYATLILSGDLQRDTALAQMTTWKQVDLPLVIRLLDEIIDIYTREGRPAYNIPSDDLGRPDGDISNNSFSTSAPHVTMTVWRFLRYDRRILGFLLSGAGYLLINCLVIACMVMLVWTKHGWWMLALFPFLLWFGLRGIHIIYLPKVFSNLRNMYQNALLIPGIIERIEPLTIICLAGLGNGSGPSYWGIKRLQIPALPEHRLRIGEVFPCVSVFEQEAGLDRWKDFDPRPISWGTGDVTTLKDLMVKLGNEDPDHLRRCVRDKILPNGVGSVLVLDEHFKPLTSTLPAPTPGPKKPDASRIKRIELVITPKTANLAWNKFADYVLDSYDTALYEYSTSEGDDLHHVFYGRDETSVVEWFHEQLMSESTEFPATFVHTITTLSLRQWKLLPAELHLDPEFFDKV